MPSASRKSFGRVQRKAAARILVRPPTRPSSGAQTINEILGDSSRLSRRSPIPQQYRTVVNWGNSTPIVGEHVAHVINPPAAVALAINKLSALSAMQAAGVRVPNFTREAPEPRRGIWLARHNLTGSAGHGIQVVREGEPLPAAPLYVEYVRKAAEYRLHVAFGRVMFCQFKLRKNDNEQTADQKLIRNHDNGWVFAPRSVEELHLTVKEEALKAVAALGLDFGAVDMIISKKDSLPFVLEVNTAPGISSPTLRTEYERVFKEFLL